MRVYDYRIVENFHLKTLKPYFYIQYYHLIEKSIIPTQMIHSKLFKKHKKQYDY